LFQCVTLFENGEFSAQRFSYFFLDEKVRKIKRLDAKQPVLVRSFPHQK